jgi:hypothetical protein
MSETPKEAAETIAQPEFPKYYSLVIDDSLWAYIRFDLRTDSVLVYRDGSEKNMNYSFEQCLASVDVGNRREITPAAAAALLTEKRDE